MSGSKKKVLLKIIFIGDSRCVCECVSGCAMCMCVCVRSVGKTAILNKYIHHKFVEDHKATIGADFTTKEISVDDKLVTLQIWDTAGQERFQSLGHAFYRGSDACVLVYDVTEEKSFAQIEHWRQSFLDQASPEDSGNFPFLLIGNKTDLEDERKVETADGQSLASRHRMLFYETSAKNGSNIETAIREIASVASERGFAPYALVLMRAHPSHFCCVCC